jgi:hypothetical protein
MTKSRLEQHRQRQVDQLLAALNSRESDRSFQWFPSAITHECKRLAVIVGLKASKVYKAVMATPISFAPGPPQASLESSRLEAPECAPAIQRKKVVAISLS